MQDRAEPGEPAPIGRLMLADGEGMLYAFAAYP